MITVDKKAKVLLDMHREHILPDMTDADLAAYFNQFTSHSEVIDRIIYLISKEQQEAELERYSEMLEDEEEEYPEEWENPDEDEDLEEGDF